MEHILPENITTFSNHGIESSQLISLENSKSQRISITRVKVKPGSKHRRHQHETSEQVWIALQGAGKLLLENESEVIFKEGEVVRFEDKEIHGFLNDSDTIFEYISITSPPIDIKGLYTPNS